MPRPAAAPGCKTPCAASAWHAATANSSWPPAPRPATQTVRFAPHVQIMSTLSPAHVRAPKTRFACCAPSARREPSRSAAAAEKKTRCARNAASALVGSMLLADAAAVKTPGVIGAATAPAEALHLPAAPEIKITCAPPVGHAPEAFLPTEVVEATRIRRAQNAGHARILSFWFPSVPRRQTRAASQSTAMGRRAAKTINACPPPAAEGVVVPQARARIASPAGNMGIAPNAPPGTSFPHSKVA